MISIFITDARVVEVCNGWNVTHPNGAILAHCTTEDEADRVRYTLAPLTKFIPPPNPEPAKQLTADTITDEQIRELRAGLFPSHYMFQWTIDAVTPSASHPHRQRNPRPEWAAYSHRP